MCFNYQGIKGSSFKFSKLFFILVLLYYISKLLFFLQMSLGYDLVRALSPVQTVLPLILFLHKNPLKVLVKFTGCATCFLDSFSPSCSVTNKYS